MVGTPYGLRPAPCPVEYLVIQAMQYCKGAMKPDDFGIYRHPNDWLAYVIESANAESDPRVEAKRKRESGAPGGGMVFNVSRPPKS